MRNKLTSSVAAAAFSFAASGLAFAADMGVPPTAPPAPVYNWTGFYAGGNIGASFGRAKTDFNIAPVTVNTNFFGSFTSPNFAGSAITEPSGFIGGGQIGYNWQYSPLIVVGLEADLQGALEKDSTNFSNAFSGPTIFLGAAPAATGVTVTGTVATQYEAKIDWFGTVRGRIGYLFGNGAVMTYLTGGLAYGRVGVDGTSTASGTAIQGSHIAPFSMTRAVGHSQINTGWTIGSGTEGKLLIPGWTYKIEYLYVDLGSLNDLDLPIVAISSVTGGQITTHTHFTDNIIRLGVNYQFH
jgi:outer membrane immunogenic protein